jgi:hypothetical protein
MTIAAGTTAIQRIAVPLNASPTVRLAATELCKYLKQALGCRLPVAPGAPAPGCLFVTTSEESPELATRIGLGPQVAAATDLGRERPAATAAPADGKPPEALEVSGAPAPDPCVLSAPEPSATQQHDRCVVAAQDGWVAFVGENPVSALYAVYDFLQDQLGIRFFGPGPQHEHVPQCAVLQLEDGFRREFSSRLEFRDYATHDMSTVSFVVKNRVNTICWLARTDPDRDLPALRAHGVKLRGPGHIWSQFVPEEREFADHPEYFPMFGGKRAPNGRTACFSNPGARRIFFGKLRQYLRDAPYWDIFAFWAEDTADRAYCGCPECSKRSVPEWYLELVNQAAEIVEEERPDATFELIAYHGTRTPPQREIRWHRDGKNMLFDLCLGYTRDLYNPFEARTHGSAAVFDMYQQWQDYLKRTGFAGKILLMDYYNLCEWPNQGPRGRALLWPMEVIHQDLQFYLKEGMDGLSDWVCHKRQCWPSPFNVWCWMQLWQQPEATVESLKDDFYPKYFGASGSAVRQYMDALEDAMHERTSPDNVARVKALQAMLDEMAEAPDEATADRVRLVRIHHEYCVLLKELMQAFSDQDESEYERLRQPYMDFFELTYRAELEGHIDIPPGWAYTLYRHVDGGRPQDLASNPMLR